MYFWPQNWSILSIFIIIRWKMVIETKSNLFSRTRVLCSSWSTRASRTTTSSTCASRPPPSRTSRCRSDRGACRTPTLCSTPPCPWTPGKQCSSAECLVPSKLVIFLSVFILNPEANYTLICSGAGHDHGQTVRRRLLRWNRHGSWTQISKGRRTCSI